MAVFVGHEDGSEVTVSYELTIGNDEQPSVKFIVVRDKRLADETMTYQFDGHWVRRFVVYPLGRNHRRSHFVMTDYDKSYLAVEMSYH